MKNFSNECHKNVAENIAQQYSIHKRRHAGRNALTYAEQCIIGLVQKIGAHSYGEILNLSITVDCNANSLDLNINFVASSYVWHYNRASQSNYQLLQHRSHVTSFTKVFITKLFVGHLQPQLGNGMCLFANPTGRTKRIPSDYSATPALGSSGGGGRDTLQKIKNIGCFSFKLYKNFEMPQDVFRILIY